MSLGDEVYQYTAIGRIATITSPLILAVGALATIVLTVVQGTSWVVPLVFAPALSAAALWAGMRDVYRVQVCPESIALRTPLATRSVQWADVIQVEVAGMQALVRLRGSRWAFRINGWWMPDYEKLRDSVTRKARQAAYR